MTLFLFDLRRKFPEFVAFARNRTRYDTDSRHQSGSRRRLLIIAIALFTALIAAAVTSSRSLTGRTAVNRLMQGVAEKSEKKPVQ
jgi:hypothetical protein